MNLRVGSIHIPGMLLPTIFFDICFTTLAQTLLWESQYRIIYKSGWPPRGQGVGLKFQWMNIRVGSIHTPGKILDTIFFTLLSPHLCHYTSADLIMGVSMYHVYANQTGRVVKALDVSSNGLISARVQSPLLVYYYIHFSRHWFHYPCPDLIMGVSV